MVNLLNVLLIIPRVIFHIIIDFPSRGRRSGSRRRPSGRGWGPHTRPPSWEITLRGARIFLANVKGVPCSEKMADVDVDAFILLFLFPFYRLRPVGVGVGDRRKVTLFNSKKGRRGGGHPAAGGGPTPGRRCGDRGRGVEEDRRVGDRFLIIIDRPSVV